tara:strand:+ start:62 stop:628 length:567 start_codon:yes stop_codon:yes gene_type:complete
MNSIFFYSNFCKNCERTLAKIVKHPLRNDLHYICIDKRKMKEDIIVVILENGTEMELPKEITKVPSLLLLNRGNKIIEGDDIMDYLNSKINSGKTTEIDEPDCYAIYKNSLFGVHSDNYSDYDMSSDELSAKGSGGVRQMHNYCTPLSETSIETPPDNYVPDKIGTNGVDMEKLIQDRELEVKQNKRI